jgi:pimeloyl-ACP methyl ester carboxylesterase
MTPPTPKLDPREDHHRIGSPRSGLSLFLRHLPPEQPPSQRRAVLYVHGGTFPSAVSIAHRFDGRSWRDVLCASGFDVWGFDFLGFGGSDRYPEMDQPVGDNPPLLRAEEAAAQVELAVRFVLGWHELERLSIIAHSWGSIAAARFAGLEPTMVERLVLFGPIARRQGTGGPSVPPAWRVVTLKDQWDRFVGDVPDGAAQVLSPRHFEEWSERYLDTDPESRGRDPMGVKIPTGPFFDIAQAWAGDLACDPARVKAPVAIIRGAWDSLCTDADARWLFDGFDNAPEKRDIKIGRATHLMHLEAMRGALHDESIAFLRG